MKRQHIRQSGGGRIRRAVDRVTGGMAESFRKSKRFLSIAALGFLLVAMVMNGLSSCSPIIQSTFQAIAVSTYPADEADMKAAERAYARMEDEMRDFLRWYEWTHDYDEYEYDTDELWHDPHVLMAILSAWNNGEAWVMDDKLYDQLALIFDQQYKLIEEVERTTRYRTVNGELEPYYYYTCKVTLINENLSHRPVYFMSKEQLGMYAMYMVTLGNYPDLFRWNRYASTIKEPGEYDIPEEVLQDPKFARLIEEAEKYIGYPYVWGGKDPSTSFDCSGFVSYVYTHSGVLNIGFLGATSLYNMCTPISPEQARPGDMVFFQGTIHRDEGISHVGIYVGEGMFLHCGNPIGYASLNSSYYQEHFYGFGHPPI